MREAQEIVLRYKNRGGVLPLPVQSSSSSDSPHAIQEDKDARQLVKWKNQIEKTRASSSSLASSSSSSSSETPSDDNSTSLREYLALCDYLDLELRTWRETSQITIAIDPPHTTTTAITTNVAMETAQGIYNRYVSRTCQMPQHFSILEESDVGKEEQTRDAGQLHDWKQSLLGNNRKNQQNQNHQQNQQNQNQNHQQNLCPDDVIIFLDEHMPLWREKGGEKQKQQASNQKALLFATEIVDRYVARGNVMPVRSKECKADPNRVQEYKDGAKLNDWKTSLRGNKSKTVCCAEVRLYLDEKVRTRDRSNI
jgi:hypothetical protein